MVMLMDPSATVKLSWLPIGEGVASRRPTFLQGAWLQLVRERDSSDYLPLCMGFHRILILNTNLVCLHALK